MTSRRLMVAGGALLTAAVLLGTVAVVGYGGSPGADLWWNETVASHRTEWMLSAAQFLDHIGGGWVGVLVVPALVLAALILTRRWRGAVFAVSAFLLSAGIVQLLKNLFGRARPEDMLVASDFGSFPSGHAANAATLAVVLYLLFPRVWVALVGAAWIITMALSRTLLSVHWATDAVGGVLLGASVPLLLAAWLLSWARTTSRRIPRPIERARVSTEAMSRA